MVAFIHRSTSFYIEVKDSVCRKEDVSTNLVSIHYQKVTKVIADTLRFDKCVKMKTVNHLILNNDLQPSACPLILRPMHAQ